MVNRKERHDENCECGQCTGEDAYLDAQARSYQEWLRTLD